MVALLEQFGAQRGKSEKSPEKRKGLNRFGSGGASGSDLPIGVERVRVQLNTLLHRWSRDRPSFFMGYRCLFTWMAHWSAIPSR